MIFSDLLSANLISTFIRPIPKCVSTVLTSESTIRDRETGADDEGKTSTLQPIPGDFKTTRYVYAAFSSQLLVVLILLIINQYSSRGSIVTCSSSVSIFSGGTSSNVLKNLYSAILS